MAKIWESVMLRVYFAGALFMCLLGVLPGAEAAGRELAGEIDFLGNMKVSALFIFGDSVVDVGTNNFLPNPAFLANFTPYGETHFHRPTGRFNNGRLWVDHLAHYLGLPQNQAYLNPSTKDYTKGVDFASAGSGHLPSILTTLKRLLNGTVANVDQQLEWFFQAKTSLINTLGQKKTEKLLSRSIFIVSTGNNDLSWGYNLNPEMQQQYSPDQVTSLIIDYLYNATKTLFDAGARKMVFSAIGPLGCLPSNVDVNGTCAESLNDLAKLFNSKLPAFLERVYASFDGIQAVYSDQYKVVEGFIKNGEAYGFTAGSKACCGIGNYNGQLAGCGALANGTAIYNLCSKKELEHHVFWDYSHPTDRVNGILADLFINGEGVVKPYNISRLCD